MNQLKLRTKKWKIYALAAGITLSATLSGCTEGTESEESRVIVEQEAPEITYTLTTVNRGDVVSTSTIRCSYTQYSGEELSFPVSGKMITKVYVKDGEIVTKGTLLAELSGGNREDEIERLEYQIKRNQYLLDQIDEDEYYEISRRWLNKIYNKGWDETGSIEQYQKENEYKKQEYSDSISFDKQQLQQIKNEVKQSKLYAGISGTVEILKDRLEGSTSVRDEAIIKVKDNSERFFATVSLEGKEHLKEGDQLEMKVQTGPGKGTYVVEPYKMSEWTDQMFFTIVEGGEGVVFETGDSGTITIILEERRNVLTVAANAVHFADGRYYVYVLNDSGKREVKWIEIGIRESNFIEITSGLEEGEKVILK